ncbi:hypothetical protein CTI12_AA038230 [Artemisia annua]|uniref:Transmembrane protein n=1 Tax=Artemisia annua TaxID=35608 RepID=A0A2U1QF53_ARTAN|nr:hypothetical protein CTI12_AA038230 [Artemisia annua]
MVNPIGTIVSGFGHVVGSIFGPQLDFLSGKNCFKCGPTWDIECYIENFCIDHLLKFFAVSLLFYIVLLALYTLYKLKVFHCIFKVIFKMIHACFSTIFAMWEQACEVCFHMLCSIKNRRRRRRGDIEMLDMSSRSDQDDTDIDTSVSEPYTARRRFWSRRDHKRDHLKRSLKAKNHRLRLGVDSGDSVYVTKRKHIKHGDVRVNRTSSFARRAGKHKRSKQVHKKR